MEYNKIVIYRDGATTKANAYINKQLIKSAQAVCSPKDPFNFNTGAAIAFERLMKPDEHTYKTGDKVRISSKGKRPINCFNVGEVVTVVKYELNDYGCKRAVDGRFQWVNEDELEPYTEPAQRTVTINGTPILPAQPDNGEVVKLYCIKDYWDWLKRGKVYEIGTDGIFTGEKALTMFKYKSVEELFSGNHSWRDCLIPLIKRPAKVGEWILPSDEWAKDRQLPTPCGIYQVGRATEEYIVFDAMRYACDDEYLVLDGYQPEPEQPKYWSGKAVCIRDGYRGFTKGKPYTFVNGETVDDDGEHRPEGGMLVGKVMDTTDMWFQGKFIPLID